MRKIAAVFYVRRTWRRDDTLPDCGHKQSAARVPFATLYCIARERCEENSTTYVHKQSAARVALAVLNYIERVRRGESSAGLHSQAKCSEVCPCRFLYLVTKFYNKKVRTWKWIRDT